MPNSLSPLGSNCFLVFAAIALVWNSSSVAAGDARPSSGLFSAQLVAGPAGVSSATVLFRDRPLIRFRSAGPPSPLQLATAVAANLQQFCEANGQTEQLRIVRSGRDASICAPDKPLIPIAEAEAATNHTTAGDLATVWMKALVEALNSPWVWVDSVTIPSGEDFPVTLMTNQNSGPGSDSYDLKLVEVRAGNNPRELILHGLQPGKTKVHVICGPAQGSFEVVVQKRAGALLKSPTVSLFGGKVNMGQCMKALQNAFVVSAQVEPGAMMGIGKPIGGGSTVLAEVKELLVPLEITGQYYYPVRTSISVPVQFQDYPQNKPTMLWVSNNPERIRNMGELFEQSLAARQPVRFLFHHKNDLSQPCDFVMEVLNQTEQESSLVVVESSGGPTASEIQAGHVAGLNYLRQRQEGSGYLLTLPGRSCYRLGTYTMNPGMIVSGLWELTNQGEGDLWFQCRAVPKGFGQVITPLGNFETPPQGSSHTYPEVERVLEETHEVGGRWTFINIGDNGTPSRDGKNNLAGNYGVLYRVNLKVTNPLPQQAEVAVTFSPTGGVARGVFAFATADRNAIEWIEVPTCVPPHEFTLKKLTVPPQGEQTISFMTIPESGSNYPVRVVVRPG